jgi:hypothetical protein
MLVPLLGTAGCGVGSVVAPAAALVVDVDRFAAFGLLLPKSGIVAPFFVVVGGRYCRSYVKLVLEKRHNCWNQDAVQCEVRLAAN